MDARTANPSDPNAAPCGLGRRLAIIVYDGTILIGLLMIAGALALPLTGQRMAGQDIPYTLFLLVVCFAYIGGLWVRGGQTLGMRAWKTKIIMVDGGDVSWKAALIRFLVGWLSIAALGLGFLAALLNKERLCWHDRASGTRLVITPKARKRA